VGTARCEDGRSESVGESVHVAVLDNGFVHDLPEHGCGGLQFGDVRGVGPDLARHFEQCAGGLVDVVDGPDQHGQQSGDRQRGDEADDQRDLPRAVI
jgi:hypothetical protein